MAGRLEGKVAAITGGASGFGEHAARRFVAEGAKVVIGDIQEAAGQAVADDIGDNCVFVRCDVTVEDDVAALVDAAVASFGRLDIMYNNAGIVGAVGPIATTPAEEWKKTIDIHLNGCFYGCKHAARVTRGSDLHHVERHVLAPEAATPGLDQLGQILGVTKLAWTESQYRYAWTPGFAFKREAWWDAVWRLKKFKDLFPALVVLPDHDWAAVEKAKTTDMTDMIVHIFSAPESSEDDAE